jgi:hypothetical protein
MKYEIKNNAVYGYSEGQEEPCLYQPVHPDGSAWIDEADMTAWAEAWVAHINDPENNLFPDSRS